MDEFTDAVLCEDRTLTVAFVSGTEEQQEEQESEILKYCDVGGTLLSSGNPILSDWHEIKSNLKRGDTLIVTSLRIISGDRGEFAGRLLALIEDKINLLPLKEHYEWLIWDKCLSGSLLPAGRKLSRLERLFDKIHERTDIMAHRADNRPTPIGHRRRDVLDIPSVGPKCGGSNIRPNPVAK